MMARFDHSKAEERFRAWFFDSALIEKVFKFLKTFAIGNDCVQRCSAHGENKFVLAGELKSRKIFSACVLSLMYDGKDFAELVLTLNCFSFAGNYYKQINGVAMGTRMGPSYANLFVGYVEHQFLWRKAFWEGFRHYVMALSE